MSGDKTLTKDELRRLILDKQNDPEISSLPYKEQQAIISAPNHPLREYMREREKVIKHGLQEHGMREEDFTDTGWDLEQ